MPNEDFVSRQWLIDEYHRRHEGTPGGALKMIEEAPAADVEPKRRWIPVTDPEIPLPKPHKRVMVFSKFTGQNTDWIGDNGDWFRTPFVTHWKPLGEPPKEEDNA